MAHMKPTFSINAHDSDGDVYEKGVFLHFQDTIVKVADNLAGFRDFVTHVESMQKEISENYS